MVVVDLASVRKLFQTIRFVICVGLRLRQFAPLVNLGLPIPYSIILIARDCRQLSRHSILCLYLYQLVQCIVGIIRYDSFLTILVAQILFIVAV
ncbi:hypothetical protein D3C75_731310 [compost metagenome]